ncbi:MAG: hypothetical protein IJF49_05405 [Clostridia bacterium]|nr:hypothetical protein [Clostridia bacterium]
MQEQALSGIGYLIIRAFTAGGALPVADAAVHIRGNTPEQSGVLISRKTNRDGLTERVALPTMPGALSDAPNAGAIPYATYNIEVSAPGYAVNTYQNVPIFDQITAIQPVELIPLSRNGREGNDSPNDNRFFESENQQL